MKPSGEVALDPSLFGLPDGSQAALQEGSAEQRSLSAMDRGTWPSFPPSPTLIPSRAKHGRRQQTSRQVLLIAPKS